jgi:hypothetical protein
MDLTPDEVRRRLASEATDAEVATLVEWYAATARAVASFPADDLRAVEPPLRSTPGPRL